jgi:hypothetical protein
VGGHGGGTTVMALVDLYIKNEENSAKKSKIPMFLESYKEMSKKMKVFPTFWCFQLTVKYGRWLVNAMG